jgi:Zn-dependent oligopeptidase
VAAVSKTYGNFDLVPTLAPHHSLWHIASESYGSRVYSYLYSQVICQDIFSEFQKAGNLMDKSTASRYRKIILEKGSSEDPKVFIEEFLGREYDARAFKEWLNSGSL